MSQENYIRSEGHVIREFCSHTIFDVPDWIWPDQKKRNWYDSWITLPKAINNRRRLLEGRARVLGEWHHTGGLVLGDWQPEVSLIDPLWKKPPVDMTLYRGIDHGQNRNPTVCLFIAVDTHRNIFVFDEYYGMDKTISEYALDIINGSGNKRKCVESFRDAKSGAPRRRYEEVYDAKRGLAIHQTPMDPRSFSQHDHSTNVTIGQLYREAGLPVIQAPGGFATTGKFAWVDLINEMFKPKNDRVHPVTGESPAPTLYIFTTCTNLKRDIESFFWKEPKDDEAAAAPKINKANSNGPNALAYAVMNGLRYIGNIYRPSGRASWAEPEPETNDAYRRV